MSIDRETFERASEEELSDLSATDRVLAFLVAHNERAFEAREIAARTELDSGTASTALSRLKERGLVEHKATYWAAVDDESRLRGHAGYERATELFNEQLGEEDEERWREHAPDEPHPGSDSS